METQKNLQASIPAALLAEAERVATAEHISVDDFVRDAVEKLLDSRQRNRLVAYGEEQAKKLGIQEKDVDRIIHEFREEERQATGAKLGR